MKNVLVLFSIIIFMTACQKNEITPPNNNEIITNDTPNQSNSLFSYQPSPDQDEIKARINDFRQRLKDAKSGAVSNRDQMTIENAEWSIEANLNATYARADYPFTKLDRVESQFVIPIDNGTINDADLLEGYESATSRLVDHYEGISDDSKQTIGINVSIDEVSSAEVRYKIKTYIGKIESAVNVSLMCDIFDNEEDFWRWGLGGINEGGKCCCDDNDPSNDDNCCNEINLDATDIFETELNARIELPEGHLYFVTFQEQLFYPSNFVPNLLNPNDDILNDGIRDYLVFSVEDENMDNQGCINPLDMEWYYCNYIDLINTYVPDNHYFHTIEVWDEVHGGNQIGDASFHHHAMVSYGTAVLCPCPTAIPGGDDPTDCC